MKHIFFLFLTIVFVSSANSQVITWGEQTSGITTGLNSVSAPDDNNAWTCGNSGKVLRTTNGGVSWSSVGGGIIPVTLSLYNIFGIDANTALVTGSSATATFVYRTSNAGVTWTQVFTQTGGFMDAIWMGNAQAGFMYGDPVGGRWSLWGTFTGGLTWDSTQFNLPQAGNEAGYNNAFYFDGVSQAVWFGTSNTRIYRSTNLILWSTETTTGQANSSALWFNTSTNGMTGGTGLLLTTNGGTAWNNTATPLPGTANIVGINGSGTNWVVVRTAPQIYFTTNNGGAWVTQYTAPAGNYTHVIKSRSTGANYWAVKDNGRISSGNFGFTGIHPVSNEVSSDFSLKQNYPNPFNPSTNIKFNIPKESFVNIRVFDVLGRLVKDLVNENLKQGLYEINFGASDLNSGTYFYTLTAGNFNESKKMLLVK